MDSGQLRPGRAFEAVVWRDQRRGQDSCFPSRSPATSSHLHGKLGDCFLGAEGALSQEGSRAHAQGRGGGLRGHSAGPRCLPCSLEVPFLYLTLRPKPKNLSGKQGDGRPVSHMGLWPSFSIPGARPHGLHCGGGWFTELPSPLVSPHTLPSCHLAE